MDDYGKYSHIKVPLSYVLGTIDEMEDALTRKLLRVDDDVATEDLKQLVGKIQGLHEARRKVELTYGAVSTEEANEYRGY